MQKSTGKIKSEKKFPKKINKYKTYKEQILLTSKKSKINMKPSFPRKTTNSKRRINNSKTKSVVSSKFSPLRTK